MSWLFYSFNPSSIHWVHSSAQNDISWGHSSAQNDIHIEVCPLSNIEVCPHSDYPPFQLRIQNTFYK